jgi:ubiquinone/menaquinone biosynthesis C-methylase UbiE
MARQQIYTKIARPEPESWDRIREMFDGWAQRGSGAGMQERHLHLGLAIIEEMPCRDNDTILDLSCGEGWFSRYLAGEVVPKGHVIGSDLSPTMIERAQNEYENPKNIRFQVATAEQLPLEDASVDHVVNIEAFYYYPDQVAAGHEIFRVLKPGGTFFTAMNYYLENRHSHHWMDLIEVPMHCKGVEQYNTLFRACGFIDVGDQRIREHGEEEEKPDGKWIRNMEQLQGFRQEGALLISGRRQPEEA